MFLDLCLNTFLCRNVWYCLIQAQKLESWGKEEGVDRDDIDMEGQQGGGGLEEGNICAGGVVGKMQFQKSLGSKS